MFDASLSAREILLCLQTDHLSSILIPKISREFTVDGYTRSYISGINKVCSPCSSVYIDGIFLTPDAFCNN